MKNFILVLLFLSLKLMANGAVYQPIPGSPDSKPCDTILDIKSPTDDTTIVKIKKRKRRQIFGGFPCNLKDPLRILEGAKELTKLTRFPDAGNSLVQLILIILWATFIIPLLLILGFMYLFVIVYIILWVSFLSLLFVLLLALIALLLGLSFTFWITLAVVSLGLLLGILSYLAIFYFC